MTASQAFRYVLPSYGTVGVRPVLAVNDLTLLQVLTNPAQSARPQTIAPDIAR